MTDLETNSGMMPAIDVDFNTAKRFLYDKQTDWFMAALAFQEVDYAPIDRTLRKIVDLVNKRLNPKKDSNPPQENLSSPGKVLVQPRGSYGSRTTLRGHVDLDLDLVFPCDYEIRFKGEERGESIPQTISQVLGCDRAFARDNPPDGLDVNGTLVVTKEGLRVVMLYIWGRLIHDNYMLPNHCIDNFDIPEPDELGPAERDEFERDLEPTPGTTPAMRIHPSKTLQTLTRSISAQITDTPGYDGNIEGQKDIDVDFFIKVVTKRFGGEEVVIGVDKNNILDKMQYQTTTFIPNGKEWINSNRLLPIDRVALMTLKWWKNSFAEKMTLKSHHLLAALNALHELPPTNELHVPNYSYLPFSLLEVMNVMVKVLTFIYQSYRPASRFQIWYPPSWSPGEFHREGVIASFPFPQISWGICEILYKQVCEDFKNYKAIIDSKVIPTFIEELKTALRRWELELKWKPGSYVFEEITGAKPSNWDDSWYKPWGGAYKSNDDGSQVIEGYGFNYIFRQQSSTQEEDLVSHESYH